MHVTQLPGMARKPCSCIQTLRRGTTCLLWLTYGVSFLSKNHSYPPISTFQNNQTCVWNGDVLSKSLYIPPWGLAQRRFSINICLLEWINYWINVLCNWNLGLVLFFGMSNIMFYKVELKRDWELRYFQRQSSNISMLLVKAPWPEHFASNILLRALHSIALQASKWRPRVRDPHSSS